jgi:N-acetylmuramoyl-L-alanine amidase
MVAPKRRFSGYNAVKQSLRFLLCLCVADSMLRLSPRTAVAVGFALLCTSGLVEAQTSAAARVEAIRYWSFGDVTRVAIQTQGEYKLTSDQIENPFRAYFDLSGLRPPSTAHHGIQTISVGDRLVKQIRVAEISPGKTRIVFDLQGSAEVTSSQLVNPDRLVVEVRPKGSSIAALSITPSVTASQRIDLSAPASTTTSDPAAPESTPRISTVQKPDGLLIEQRVYTSAAPAGGSHASAISVPPVANKVIGVAAPAKKDSAGDRSLVRVFGLKLGKVVIDAGHGGHDTGTIGPNRLMEKDLVLDVALRLGKLITQQLAAEVVYTRSDDTFIPLENRTKIANDEKADLFISIHANSSPAPGATGVETYFFNLTSDKSGLDLATRENAAAASAISDLNDLLHKAVLQTKLEESREFAQRVQASLWASSVKLNNRSRDRGVRQAPFVVLIGATMPSVLAEIGFVSNPHDEKLLQRNDQRQRIAEALFKGISQYASSLSHTQMARSE